jgi:hypothetical protein
MQILAITFSSAAVNHHQGCLKPHCGETKPAGANQLHQAIFLFRNHQLQRQKGSQFSPVLCHQA